MLIQQHADVQFVLNKRAVIRLAIVPGRQRSLAPTLPVFLPSLPIGASSVGLRPLLRSMELEAEGGEDFRHSDGGKVMVIWVTCIYQITEIEVWIWQVVRSRL